MHESRWVEELVRSFDYTYRVKSFQPNNSFMRMSYLYIFILNDDFIENIILMEFFFLLFSYSSVVSGLNTSVTYFIWSWVSD